MLLSSVCLNTKDPPDGACFTETHSPDGASGKLGKGVALLPSHSVSGRSITCSCEDPDNPSPGNKMNFHPTTICVGNVLRRGGPNSGRWAPDFRVLIIRVGPRARS
eukprot:2768791-Rhodomonas_salina.2